MNLFYCLYYLTSGTVAMFKRLLKTLYSRRRHKDLVIKHAKLKLEMQSYKFWLIYVGRISRDLEIQNMNEIKQNLKLKIRMEALSNKLLRTENELAMEIQKRNLPDAM